LTTTITTTTNDDDDGLSRFCPRLFLSEPLEKGTFGKSAFTMDLSGQYT